MSDREIQLIHQLKSYLRSRVSTVTEIIEGGYLVGLRGTAVRDGTVVFEVTIDLRTLRVSSYVIPRDKLPAELVNKVFPQSFAASVLRGIERHIRKIRLERQKHARRKTQ